MILYGNGNVNHQEGTDFIHKGIMSSGKKGTFISDTMSHIILKGRLCDTLL
jgi:hypothetical protein